MDRPVPADLLQLTLTDQTGASVNLASLRGKVVMVVPFLTLCSDICPMTTGNLVVVERALRADHAASSVNLVELTVDPGRDTPARLAAYAKLTDANWRLVTEEPDALQRLAAFFGFFYQQVPQDSPPAIDWLTGRPLTYDVNHSDGFVILDGQGHERFATGAAPQFNGTLNPQLHAFLNAEGRSHLAHPPQPGWQPSQALGALSWVLGRTLASPGT
jgi:protein SCO1/2